MRHMVVALVIILFSIIATTAISLANTGGHGCAPQVPPGIPGSPAPVPAVSGIIVINEVLLVPHSTWNCSENGSYFVDTDTWLELYNTQNQPFNLYSAHTTIDSGPSTNNYYLPFGAAIPARGYLVLFPRTSATFAVTATTTLRVLIAGVVVDQITVPQLGPDQSYARTADGASTWQITSMPTIDASNTSLQSTPTPPTAPTPTSTASKKQSSDSGNTHTSSGSGGAYTGTPYANNNKPLANGVQPPWNNLQLPTTPTTGTVDTPLNTSPSSPSQSSAGLDLPHRIVLTLLAIALACTLFWCWRLFKTT